MCARANALCACDCGKFDDLTALLITTTISFPVFCLVLYCYKRAEHKFFLSKADRFGSAKKKKRPGDGEFAASVYQDEYVTTAQLPLPMPIDFQPMRSTGDTR
jgi:hypothetical protein